MSRGPSARCKFWSILRFFRDPCIVVAGAVHIDIVGEFDLHVADDIDRPGNIRYSVGGTAFNIAANLADQNKPVRLATLVRPESFLTPLIIKKIRLRGIGTALVERIKGISEAGFAAHLNIAQNLVDAAVSCTPISEKNLSFRRIKRAMRCASLVVADCNLSTETFRQIATAAQDFGLPLVVDGVSESKIVRCVQATPDNVRFTALIAKIDECAALMDGQFKQRPENAIAAQRRQAAEALFDQLETQNSASTICEKAKSHLVIAINADHRSYRIYTDDGKFTRETINFVVNGNMTGIGDAVASAVAALIYELDGDFDFNSDRGRLRVLAEDYVSRVAAQKTAVPDAELAYRGDETVLDKVTAFLTVASANPYIRIVAALVTIVAFILGKFFIGP